MENKKWTISLAVINDEYQAFKLGHSIMIEKHIEAERVYLQAKKDLDYATSTGRSFLQKRYDEAKKHLDILELLVVNMWDAEKKALVKYAREYERLVSIGCDENELKNLKF